jgi:predicted nucleotidyltransferase
MDQTVDIIDKVKEYKKLVADKFPIHIEQVFLFGSYAKGNPRLHSDIDVALVVQHLDDNYDFFQTEPLLWTLRREVDTRIEPVLIARDTDFGGLLDEIQQTGMEI